MTLLRPTIAPKSLHYAYQILWKVLLMLNCRHDKAMISQFKS
ncbi:hypothetical protein LX69_01928 [Breznakibacter xylanolyticus]|uniref:Uncharacterized protein n=1 Tax=Breznakibacter xylanolyticus TaxID=990 RepID=A0A2W7N9V9_9BACT|nr:hypothetical protein LX69_01928 [Breznakibacter xylanolyticus]